MCSKCLQCTRPWWQHNDRGHVHAFRVIQCGDAWNRLGTRNLAGFEHPPYTTGK